MNTPRARRLGARRSPVALSGPGPLMESMEPRALLAGDVAATFGPQGLGSFYVPGERVIIDPAITNVGDQTITGRVTLQLFLTTDGTIVNPNAPLVSLNNLQVTIQPGATLVRKVNFTLANDLAPGSYILVAKVIPGAGVSNPNTANDEAQSGGLSLQYRFGFFLGRQNVIMRLRDADGTLATFSARNNVNARLEPAVGGGLNLLADSGNAGGSITVTSSGGDGFFDIKNITITGAIGAVNMPGVRFTGDATINNNIRSLRLGPIVGPSSISIFATSGTPELRFGDVDDLTLESDVGLKLIDVDCWGDTGAIDENIVSAPFVTTIVSRCDWAPSMNLTGALNGRAVNSIRVSGAMTSEFWRTIARIGSISSGSILGTSMNIGGTIDKLTTLGNINGATIAATGFGTILVGVNLINSKILAGASLGNDNVLGNPPGTPDDLFDPGSIKSITVTLDMTNSIVAAGINPRPPGSTGTAPYYLNGDAIAVSGTSAISKIIVNGVIDGSSRFMSARVAATARVAGVNVPTLRDSRFQIPDFIAPTARIESGLAGVAPFRIIVVYTDNISVDPDSVRLTDLQVTGPNAFVGTAAFVSGSINAAGNVITAIYSLTPPGGSWDPAENGEYTVNLPAGAIKDYANNAMGATNLGEFEIRTATQPSNQFPTPSQSTHGQTVVNSAGDLHSVFIENGNLLHRRVTNSGQITITPLPAFAGVLRATVALLGNGSPVIVAATADTIRRFNFDGTDWTDELLTALTPPVGRSVTAISAAVDATGALRVGYVLSGPVEPSATSDTTSLFLLTQANPGDSAVTTAVVTQIGLNSTGTTETAVRNFQIVTDAQSKVHMIFTPEYFRSGNLLRTRLFYTNNVGGNFSSPVVVSEPPVGSSAGDAGLTATLALNPLTNNVGIASMFVQRNQTSGEVIRASLLLHTRQGNGSFVTSTVTNKSAGYKGSGDRGAGALPSLRYDAQGRPNIAFADYALIKNGADVRTSVGQIRHAIFANNRWNFITVFSQTAAATSSIANITLNLVGSKLIFSGDVRSPLNSTTSVTQFMFSELTLA